MKPYDCRGFRLAVYAAVGLLVVLVMQVSRSEAGEARKFTLINLLLDDTKIWLPSALIVHQGDEVELTLINKLDAPHGFKMADFGIEEVVQPKATITVQFLARKAGIYPYICHIHPPHIGGQLLVLDQ